MSLTLAKWLALTPTSLEENSNDGSLQVKLNPINAIEATVDGLQVKASGIVTAMVADAAITEAKLANTFIRADGVNTFTADQSLGGFRLTNVAAPVAGTDAVNRNYVDAKAAGLTWKNAVVAATTANITLSGTQTIDGVAVVAGNRVLVKDQTNATENGIYVVASGAWTRSSDLDETTPNNEFIGAAVWVEAGGATQGSTGWAQNNSAFATIGTDSITWAQFNGAASLTAGNGLSKTGNTFDVNVDGVTIEITADALNIKDAGVSTAKIADTAVTAAKINADVAGNGLVQALNGALDVNVDGSTIEITADSLNVKDSGIVTAKLADNAVTTIKINAAAVTAAKINADVAGNGLVQALSGALDVNVDGSTLEITADALNVKDLGITAAKLNSSVAGLGLGLDGITNAINVLAGNGIAATSGEGGGVALTTLSSAWNLGNVAGVTITNVPTPVNNSDVVNKSYVDTAIANANNRTTQTFTLSATDITNKYITLAAAPQVPAQVMVYVKGAPFQIYGDDYVMDVTNTDRVTWSALGLDGLISVGDKVTVEYDL